MAKPQRLPALIAVALVLAFAGLTIRADNKAPNKGDDKSFSTFVKYLKSNYDAKGQSTFGMVSFARFLVKVIKPAGVKNFKVSMLRDLQFTNLKVDDDLGTFIRKNVHSDWHPMSQVVSLKNNQYVYVYFMPEKNDVKFLVVAVQQRDAFVVQFKFEPERLAKFIEKPEILGISLTGDDRQQGNSGPADPTTAAAESQATDQPADQAVVEKKVEAKVEEKTDVKTEARTEVRTDVKSDAKAETRPDVKPDAKPEVKPDAKPETRVNAKPTKKPPVLIRKDSEQ